LPFQPRRIAAANRLPATPGQAPSLAGLSFVLLLAACAPAAPPAPAPPAAAAPHAAPAAADADYVAPDSQMRFPPMVAGFDRLRASSFAEDGGIEAVGYVLRVPDGEIAASVALRRAESLPTVGLSGEQVDAARERACRARYAALARDIRYFHPDGSGGAPREVVLLRDGRPRPGLTGRFTYAATFAGKRRAVATDLYLFCFAGGAWDLEYRFSAPADFSAADYVDTFVRALPWTGAPAR
jgi:hypothetical protein